jgi:hypothetical protein
LRPSPNPPMTAPTQSRITSNVVNSHLRVFIPFAEEFHLDMVREAN